MQWGRRGNETVSAVYSAASHAYWEKVAGKIPGYGFSEAGFDSLRPSPFNNYTHPALFQHGKDWWLIKLFPSLAIINAASI